MAQPGIRDDQAGHRGDRRIGRSVRQG